MLHCWNYNADLRPSFKDLIGWLETMITDNTDYLDLNPLLVNNATYLQPICRSECYSQCPVYQTSHACHSSATFEQHPEPDDAESEPLLASEPDPVEVAHTRKHRLEAEEIQRRKMEQKRRQSLHSPDFEEARFLRELRPISSRSPSNTSGSRSPVEPLNVQTYVLEADLSQVTSAKDPTKANSVSYVTLNSGKKSTPYFRNSQISAV